MRAFRQITCQAALLIITTVVSERVSTQERYRYIRIEDTRGDLREFGEAIAVNNRGDVAYLAIFDSGGRAVFTGNEQKRSIVADTRDGAFEDLVEMASLNDRGTVVFASRGASPAVWKWTAGKLSKVADLSDGPFSHVGGGPSINAAGAVAFWGRLMDGSQGIFVRGPDGVLSKLAGPGFSSLDEAPALSNSGVVAFIGQTITGVDGVFAADRQGVRAVASSAGRFHNFSGGPGINTVETVVFHANQDTGPSLIALVNTPTGDIDFVDDGGVFQDVSRPTINTAGDVTFEGMVGGKRGIFAGPDPLADNVVGAGDLLDGEPVHSVGFFRGFNDRGQVAFVAYFATYSALYRADPIGR